jgi:hypothetical protein
VGSRFERLPAKLSSEPAPDGHGLDGQGIRAGEIRGLTAAVKAYCAARGTWGVALSGKGTMQAGRAGGCPEFIL